MVYFVLNCRYQFSLPVYWDDIFVSGFEPRRQQSCAPAVTGKRRLAGTSLINPGTKKYGLSVINLWTERTSTSPLGVYANAFSCVLAGSWKQPAWPLMMRMKSDRSHTAGQPSMEALLIPHSVSPPLILPIWSWQMAARLVSGSGPRFPHHCHQALRENVGSLLGN